VAGFRLPEPTCWSSYDIDDGTLCRQLSCVPIPLGHGGTVSRMFVPCLLNDAPPPPQPKAQPTQANAPPAQPQQPATPPQPQKTLQKQVEEILDAAHFDLPLVADQKRAFFNYMLISLDQITDYIHESLPKANRADIWSAVWQAYRAKQIEAEQQHWSFIVQMLYTPQFTAWSSQPLQPQQSRWQNPLQLSLGGNYRAHWYGEAGWEHTLQANGSFFNLGSDNLDWFQNLTGSYQASYVSPLGHEFRFLGFPTLWAYLQGSVFAQIAAGLGTNYDKDADGKRQVYYTNIERVLPR
jgi:hypothetical protein